MECLVELPLTEGELIPGTRDQFILVPFGEQVAQIPQVGANNAYPLHPFCFCRLVNFL
jgi:hypothetical protein